MHHPHFPTLTVVFSLLSQCTARYFKQTWCCGSAIVVDMVTKGLVGLGNPICYFCQVEHHLKNTTKIHEGISWLQYFTFYGDDQAYVDATSRMLVANFCLFTADCESEVFWQLKQNCLSVIAGLPRCVQTNHSYL